MNGIRMLPLRRAALTALGLLLTVSAAAAVREESLSARCAVPSELLADAPAKLPRVAARIREGKPVKIVAIGGASTAGAAAFSPSRTYPHQLEDDLRERHPGLAVTVVNRGVPREAAGEMVERFDRDVIPEDPDLVLWETGITDAVRGISPDSFNDAVQAGINKLRGKDIDVILINMQYSRRTTSVIDFDKYLDALHGIADVNDIYMFRRYEIMAYWSESGVFDFDHVPEGDRAAQAAEVYACIAMRLADAIDFAIR